MQIKKNDNDLRNLSLLTSTSVLCEVVNDCDLCIIDRPTY